MVDKEINAPLGLKLGGQPNPTQPNRFCDSMKYAVDLLISILCSDYDKKTTERDLPE